MITLNKPLGLACLLMVTSAHSSILEKRAQPNIVVLMVDDLGCGDVSSLFRDNVKTPHIDNLAKDGVKFTRGYVTAPMCGPSRAAFFSGQYQQRFGYTDNFCTIPPDLLFFQLPLQQAGYRTALIGKWHDYGRKPHQRAGFDETLVSEKSRAFIDYFNARMLRNGTPETFSEYTTDMLAREAIEFIERNKSRPFFLTLTFNAPHIGKVVGSHKVHQKNYDAAIAAGKTYDVPKDPMAPKGEAMKFAERYPGDFARADTVATIVALDAAVGRVLAKLKNEKLDQDTIVFFYSDNGGHPENRSESLPLRDYKWTLYEGGIRVPFLAVYPGVFKAGLEFNHPVHQIDIFPTCAALAGAETPDHLDGVNLAPYLTGKNKSAPHKALYFGHHTAGRKHYIGAIIEGDWKLLLTDGTCTALYNLKDDFRESSNVASNEPGRVDAMTRKWNAWQAAMPPPSKDGRGKQTIMRKQTQ